MSKKSTAKVDRPTNKFYQGEFMRANSTPERRLAAARKGGLASRNKRSKKGLPAFTPITPHPTKNSNT